MNTQGYTAEVNRQLQNSNFYKPLPKDPTDDVSRIIRTTLSEGISFGYLDKKTTEFLFNKYPRTPVFYILPKIHKSLNAPPGRPIVSGNDSLLEPLCQYMEYYLHPFAIDTPSYILDTKTFIGHVENTTIPKEASLVTLDVESLYTNVPLPEVRTIIETLLDSRPTREPPTHFLLDILDIILDYNFFRYLKQFYLQIKGVAMGSSCAPSIANIYMIHFEKTFILHDNNPFRSKIIKYYRFIDDLFFVIQDQDTATQFLQWINDQDPNIRLSGTIHDTSVNFLDVTVFKDHSQQLKIRPYHKPTDRNSLLHASSFHAPHLLNNLPYGQYLRLKRNASFQHDYKIAAYQLTQSLLQRGYTSRTLTAAQDRAEVKNRKDLLAIKTSDKPREDRICTSLQFTPHTSSIKKLIYKHWHLLSNIPGCQKPPIIGLKRTKSLRNYLVKSDQLTYPEASTKGHYKCGSCNVCKYALQVKEFTNIQTGFKFQIEHFSNCNTKNSVYAWMCPCHKIYIGKSTRPIKLRINEHRSRIRNRVLEAPMVEHYIQQKHTEDDFVFFIIWKPKVDLYTRRNIDRLLLQQEARYIHLFETMSPKGLNEHQDYNSFL
uniref:uncharacterized protein LOC114593837 n=1 Tax=Podarcis muralis TaxID=64176 RepID=UPI00109F984E|nr:uncharacterized protein LOC114593837 [Podarcis muralis]